MTSVDPRQLQTCPVCDGELDHGWVVNGPGFWAEDTKRVDRRLISLIRDKTFKPAAKCASCETVVVGLDPGHSRW